jgi:hypothetical protein
MGIYLADGLTYTSSAGLYYVRAPASLPFEAIACAPFDVGHENGVLWDRISWLEGVTFPTTYTAYGPPEWPEVRVYVVLALDFFEANRRHYESFPPVVQGDLIGATRIFKYDRCKGNQYVCPSTTADPRYSDFEADFEAEEVVLSTPFKGCGGNPGSCLYADPAGDWCRRWTSSSSTIAGAYEADCSLGGGTYGAGDCAVEGRVAGCRNLEEDGSFTVDWFYPPWTPEGVFDARSCRSIIDP